MNISATQVINQIEEQLALLKKAVTEENQIAAREHASMIEGYCQLLKSSPNQIESRPITNPIAAPTPSPKPPITTQAPTALPDESTEKPGSLFDF